MLQERQLGMGLDLGYWNTKFMFELFKLDPEGLGFRFGIQVFQLE